MYLQLRGVLRFSAEQQFAQHHKGARGSRRRLPYVPKVSDDRLPIAYHHLQRAQLPRRVQQQGKECTFARAHSRIRIGGRRLSLRC